MEAVMPAQQRHLLAPPLPLVGTFNTRDLGGHRTLDGRQVRWRRLIRSDALGRLTDEDVALLARIGVETVVDLRSPAEVDHQGRAPVERFGARHVHLPVLAETWDPDLVPAGASEAHFLAERYCEMTQQGFDAIAAAIECAAEATGPVLFHCAVGKDRTGVLAALLLALLGVDDEAIARDYARSQEPVARLIEAYHRDADPAAAAPAVPGAFLAAPPVAIRLWLDVLRSGASIDEVVTAQGVSPLTVERLRRNLLA